jgi:hypothetical protein
MNVMERMLFQEQGASKIWISRSLQDAHGHPQEASRWWQKWIILNHGQEVVQEDHEVIFHKNSIIKHGIQNNEQDIEETLPTNETPLSILKNPMPLSPVFHMLKVHQNHEFLIHFSKKDLEKIPRHFIETPLFNVNKHIIHPSKLHDFIPNAVLSDSELFQTNNIFYKGKFKPSKCSEVIKYPQVIWIPVAPFKIPLHLWCHQQQPLLHLFNFWIRYGVKIRTSSLWSKYHPTWFSIAHEILQMWIDHDPYEFINSQQKTFQSWYESLNQKKINPFCLLEKKFPKIWISQFENFFVWCSSLEIPPGSKMRPQHWSWNIHDHYPSIFVEEKPCGVWISHEYIWVWIVSSSSYSIQTQKQRVQMISQYLVTHYPQKKQSITLLELNPHENRSRTWTSFH